MTVEQAQALIPTPEQLGERQHTPNTVPPRQAGQIVLGTGALGEALLKPNMPMPAPVAVGISKEAASKDPSLAVYVEQERARLAEAEENRKAQATRNRHRFMGNVIAEATPAISEADVRAAAARHAAELSESQATTAAIVATT